MSLHVETPNPHPGLGLTQFVILMAALMALGALGIDSMLPALPAMARGFHVARANDQQLVVTVFLLSFGAAQLVYGPLTDRYGRKPVLLWALAFYGLFAVMAAVAPSFGLLLVWRGLQGAAVAATRIAPISIVRDSYSGRTMAQVMSLTSMAFMAVPIMAPALGQAVLLFASWRWIFGVLAIATAAVALWTLIKLPETLHPEDRRAINVAEVLEAFRITLQSRVGMGYTLASTVIFGALFGFVSSAPQVFDQAFHQPEKFTLVFATVAGFIALASLVNARLVNRLGMRVMAHGALLAFIAVSAVHSAFALSGHETIVSFTILQSAAMFGFGILSGNFAAMAMDPMGHVAGSAASAQGFISMVGGSLIGFLIGQQFDGTLVPIAVGYLVCGLVALGIVLVAEKGKLFASRHRPNPDAAGIGH